MEEMEQPEFPEVEEKEPKRSTLLLILCILTFIGSGYSFLYYLLLPVAKSQLPEMMSVYGSLFSQLDATTQTRMNELLDFMATVPSWKYLLVALGYAGSVAETSERGTPCLYYFPNPDIRPAQFSHWWGTETLY